MSPCTVFLMFVCFHQACCNGVKVFSGQSAVLKSGADQSQKLIRVQWSIYTNTTFIASLKEGNIIYYNVWKYKDRLNLNNVTGDLTILDVTVSDSMVYDVALVYSDESRQQEKVNLNVQESIKKPAIQEKLNLLKDGQCHVSLHCSVLGSNVNLSWSLDSDFSGSYISGSPKNSHSVLYAWFSSKRNSTFNCTASSGQQRETALITVGCSETTQKCETSRVCSSSCSCASSVFGTIVVTLLVVLALEYAFIKRVKIQDFCTSHILPFFSGSSPSSVRPAAPGKKDAVQEEKQTSDVL